MKELFENLKIRQFENGERQSSSGNQSQTLELLNLPEHMELAQFGRVMHDWRPKEKQKKPKQQDNK